jgi:hypothetical protein
MTTTASITAPLISLAILKVHWDTRRRDYIDNFVPMVAECIRTSEHDVISIAALQQEVRTAFGLRLPQHNLRIILNRIAKLGLIQSKDRVYVRDQSALRELNFHAVQSSVVAMHEQLIASFRSFARERHQLEWTIDDTEKALHSYLETFALLDGTDGESSPKPAEGAEAANFVAGAFVRHLRQNDPKAFEYLETIVKGDILATAIFLPDPSRAAQKFRKTSVYLDTSVLVFALGYAGESRAAPAREMLELLYQAGADLRCFSHTADEIRSILTACAYRIEKNQLVDSYGPSIEYFLERGFPASEIRIFIEKLEKDLAGLRVKIVDKPPFEADYMVDEQQLAEHIKKYVAYRADNALWRDVGSISSVIRLRGGHDTPRVEECRAVFVSTNGGLVRAAREFGRSEAVGNSVPPALTDHALTNMLWLKLPVQAQDLPRQRLIAASYAATQPDDKLWSKFLEQLAKDRASATVSEEDYYLLRHSLQARAALMEVTLGEDEAFTDGTVQEILEIAKDNIRRDLREQLQSETSARAEAERQAEDARQAAIGAATAAEQHKAASELEHQRLLDEISRREELRRTNRRNRAVGWARKTARVLWVVLVLAFVLGSFASYLQASQQLQGSFVWYALAALQAAIVLFGIASSIWGTSVEGIVRSIERWLADRFDKLLATAAGEQVGM